MFFFNLKNIFKIFLKIILNKFFNFFKLKKQKKKPITTLQIYPR